MECAGGPRDLMASWPTDQEVPVRSIGASLYPLAHVAGQQIRGSLMISRGRQRGLGNAVRSCERPVGDGAQDVRLLGRHRLRRTARVIDPLLPPQWPPSTP